MKIKRLIMAMLLVFSLVPLYIFGSVMIASTQRNFEKMESDNLEALSNTIIMNIESYTENQRLSMLQVAQTKSVQQAVKASIDGTLDPESTYYDYMEDVLQESREYAEYVVSVSIVDVNYKVVGSTENFMLQESSTLRNVSADILNQDFYLGRVYAREFDDGEKRVVLACQKIYCDEDCIGFVLAEIDTTYFDMLRYHTTLTKNDIICIKDRFDEVITAGRFGKKSYSENAHEVTECEEYKEKWDAINRNTNSKGSIRFEADGVKYITYYSGIENSDWLIQVTVNMSKRNETSSSFILIGVLSLVCVTLVLFGANYLLTRKITQPIDRIGGTLSEVQERNDYSMRIHVDKNGELGQIAEQINMLLACVEHQTRQEKQKQKQLEKDVELDPLTGILNKKAIHEDMEELVSRASELGIEITIGFVDVDNFRDFNTKYGHQIGDEVLKHVAASLRKAVPGVVGRNGGDEFIFCMLKRRISDNLNLVMDAFYSGLKEGVTLESGEVVSVTCSVGIMCAKGEHLAMKELEKGADSAMYEAKNSGKNTYHIITNDESKSL